MIRSYWQPHNHYNFSKDRPRRYTFNNWQQAFRLYVKSWTNVDQTNEAVERNPHTPYIDWLKFVTLIYKNQKSTLSHVTAAPQVDRLKKKSE